MWWIILGAASAAATYFGYRGMRKHQPRGLITRAFAVTPPTAPAPAPAPTTDATVSPDILRMQVLMRMSTPRFGIFHQPDAIHNDKTVIPMMFFDGDPVDALRMLDQVATNLKPGGVMYIWDRTRTLDGPVAARSNP